MHFVLLTWNPGSDDNHAWDPDTWNDEMVTPTLAGKIVRTSWSVGRHINNIGPGDVAFMYRQGEFGRGVVARGIIRSHPLEDVRWDDDTRPCNYIDIEWQECLPIDLAADVEQLEKLAPEFAWRQVYASGRQLRPSVGKKVQDAWQRYVSSDSVCLAATLFASDVWRDYVSSEEVAFV